MIRVRKFRCSILVPVVCGRQLFSPERLPDHSIVLVHIKRVFKTPMRQGFEVNTLPVDTKHGEGPIVVFNPVVSDKIEIATALELLHKYVDTVVNVKFPHGSFTTT